MPAAPPAAVQSAAPETEQPAPPPPIDMQRVAALEQRAKSSPADAAVRTELGNLYFDSKRFDQAIPWYEASLKLNPREVGVSTDLAVCYHYTGDPDRALKQIETSLSIDPGHLKTLLNQGIIRAFGKQDLAGALQSWEAVVKIAPDSPEAARARQGIDGLKAAHDANAAQGARGASGS